jgi:hypothetical protein
MLTVAGGEPRVTMAASVSNPDEVRLLLLGAAFNHLHAADALRVALR